VTERSLDSARLSHVALDSSSFLCDERVSIDLVIASLFDHYEEGEETQVARMAHPCVRIVI